MDEETKTNAGRKIQGNMRFLLGENIHYGSKQLTIIGYSRGYLQCYNDRDNVIEQFAGSNVPQEINEQVDKLIKYKNYE
jgi:hypothetical protein